MANTNDQRILELRKKIAEKKEKLGKSSKFNPVTNCSIELDGVRHNIQVLTKCQLISLMVKIQSYLTAAKTLKVDNEYEISGYSPVDWISDIQDKIALLSRKEEEKSLRLMEDKLSKLLSEDKKVELEIDEIESLLK